jgi:hypothetical protein
MKTTIVVLTLLTLVVASTVASADGGYPAYVQQAYKQQQAAQMAAEQSSGRIFSDVEKNIPAVAMPDMTGYGAGWGTASAAGARIDAPSRVKVYTTCPSY